MRSAQTKLKHHNMPIPSEQRDLLTRLEEKGVQFLLKSPCGGLFLLKAEEAEHYLDDPDRFLANHYQISIQQLLSWRSFQMSGGRCQGTKKNGQPCTRSASMPTNDPSRFAHDVAGRFCRQHQAQSTGPLSSKHAQEVGHDDQHP